MVLSEESESPFVLQNLENGYIEKIKDRFF